MKVDPSFAERVSKGTPFNAEACLNCGQCTALCPIGIHLLPRKLFRYVLLGAEEKVLEETDTIYSCLLCKMCEENCPAGVHITENVRALRVLLAREEMQLAPVEG
ncbi:MAG: 4Fe-4S dicluster domain-containing protein [Euryarchaeota archaeon]|nr:4Fe-4S dicluster domain-containing protein [Euryarchaeota archaeon]MDE2046144.1 4Fe-4S dicluster domain-containing protein [Thermoplasmata archaeon]